MKNKQSEQRRNELKRHLGKMVTLVEHINSLMNGVKHTGGRATSTLDPKPKQVVFHEEGVLRATYQQNDKFYEIVVTEVAH